MDGTLRARLPLDNARPINPGTTRARIEALSKVGRLSSATRVCQQLDSHLKGLPATPPLPAEPLRLLIDELHPANNEHDLLPDEALDPAPDLSIQMTPIIEDLPPLSGQLFRPNWVVLFCH